MARGIDDNSMFKQFLFRVSLFLVRAAHISRYFVRRILGEVSTVQGVRVILARRHGKRIEIALMRHWYAPGVWTLPGGGIKRTENIYDAAAREVREECGYYLHSVEGVVGTYVGPMGKGDEVVVVYSQDFHGSMSLLPNFEVMERGFFGVDALPDTLSPGNRRRIYEYLKGERNLKGREW